MLCRSLGFWPVMVSIQTYIPMPSGYCGASRPMCHSGATYASPSRRAAPARVIRVMGFIGLVLRALSVGRNGTNGVARRVPGELHRGTLRRHAHISLHLLMQR